MERLRTVAGMFLRCQRRKKDGKVREYWSIVESRRLGDGRVAQRQALYRGEINASQREAWRKTIEVQDAGQRRQVALFPAGSMPCDGVDAVGVCLSQLRLERPRLALQLWQQLELDAFWRPRWRPSRQGTPPPASDQVSPPLSRGRSAQERHAMQRNQHSQEFKAQALIMARARGCWSSGGWNGPGCWKKNRTGAGTASASLNTRSRRCC